MWLRRVLGNAIGAIFDSGGKPAEKRMAFALPITAKRAALSAAAALVLLLVLLSGQLLLLRGEPAKSKALIARLHHWIYRHRSEVAVLSASYGLNCRAFAVAPPGLNSATLGNVTQKIKDSCDLSAKCDVLVNVDELGDPASGCGKDFAVTYQCTGRGEVKTAYLPGEANGKSVVLECLATAKAAVESSGPRQAPSQ